MIQSATVSACRAMRMIMDTPPIAVCLSCLVFFVAFPQNDKLGGGGGGMTAGYDALFLCAAVPSEAWQNSSVFFTVTQYMVPDICRLQTTWRLQICSGPVSLNDTPMILGLITLRLSVLRLALNNGHGNTLSILLVYKSVTATFPRSLTP